MNNSCVLPEVESVAAQSSPLIQDFVNVFHSACDIVGHIGHYKVIYDPSDYRPDLKPDIPFRRINQKKGDAYQLFHCWGIVREPCSASNAITFEGAVNTSTKSRTTHRVTLNTSRRVVFMKSVTDVHCLDVEMFMTATGRSVLMNETATMDDVFQLIKEMIGMDFKCHTPKAVPVSYKMDVLHKKDDRKMCIVVTPLLGTQLWDSYVPKEKQGDIHRKIMHAWNLKLAFRGTRTTQRQRQKKNRKKKTKDKQDALATALSRREAPVWGDHDLEVINIMPDVVEDHICLPALDVYVAEPKKEAVLVVSRKRKERGINL